MVMIKDKKRCTIKDTMSIKISFMHYRNYFTWTKVKLPVVFEEFYMVYMVFLAPFLFSLSLSFGKSLTSARIKGGLQPPQPPVFYGPD